MMRVNDGDKGKNAQESRKEGPRKRSRERKARKTKGERQVKWGKTRKGFRRDTACTLRAQPKGVSRGGNDEAAPQTLKTSRRRNG